MEFLPKTNESFDDRNILSSDNGGRSRTASVMDGQGRTVSSGGGDWLTTDEVVLHLIEHFGVKRDRRSAERYCANKKVEAFFDDAQGIWFANSASVDVLGAQLKEIQDRKLSKSTETAEAASVQSQMSRTSSAENKNSQYIDEEEQQSLHELRAELTQAKFEVKAKSQVINTLQTEREKDRERFIELASEKGRFEQEVEQLQKTLQLSAPPSTANPQTEIKQPTYHQPQQSDSFRNPADGMSQF